MRERNKLFSLGIVFFALTLLVFLIVPLQAEAKESEESGKVVNSSKNNTVIELDFFPVASKTNAITIKTNTRPSNSTYKLLQSIRKENLTGKVQSAVNMIKSDNNISPNNYITTRPRVKQSGKGLYTATLVSLVGLNIADYFSTKEALTYPGLQEANPIMKPFSKNNTLLAAAKLGITTFSYFYMNKLFKKNKVIAWVASIAANVALSYIVYNNYRLIGQQRALIN